MMLSITQDGHLFYVLDPCSAPPLLVPRVLCDGLGDDLHLPSGERWKMLQLKLYFIA